MAHQNRSSQGGHTPLDILDFEQYRTSFLTEVSEERDAYRQDYYRLSREMEDELTALIGIDKVAEHVLISSASRCAMEQWTKWKKIAEATGAFTFSDVISQVSEICIEAMNDFDHSRSKSFPRHAIGRVKLRFLDWAICEVHEAKTGQRVPAITLHRLYRDDPHLSPELKKELSAEPFTLVSLNETLDSDEGDKIERGDLIPDDQNTPDEIVLDRETQAAFISDWASFEFDDEEHSSLMLWMGEGLSLNETAEEIGISRNTVKVRIASAGRKMGKTYKELEAVRETLHSLVKQ